MKGCYGTAVRRRSTRLVLSGNRMMGRVLDKLTLHLWTADNVLHCLHCRDDQDRKIRWQEPASPERAVSVASAHA